MAAAPSSPLHPSPFSRPTWAQINLVALQNNARALFLAQGQSTPLIAVIKANAYGHGAVEVAHALLAPQMKGAVKMLAVASVDEGETLRAAGIAAPILLLSAILPEEAAAAVAFDLTVTLSTQEVAAALEVAARAQSKTAQAHFKIDTGMSRLGFGLEHIAQEWQTLRQYSHLKVGGVFTHFACADEGSSEFSLRQIRAFENSLAACGIASSEYCIHAANSAAALRFAEAAYSAIRPGLALYGSSPFGTRVSCSCELQPVMSLRARVTELRQVSCGQSVSYGATWTAARASTLALVPIGYADGYPRALSNQGEVLLRGKRCPLVGRVTMDQILVDVTEIAPRIEVGEIVTVWGEGENGEALPVEEAAEKAGTIAYELLCRVAPRVPRIYNKSVVNHTT
jgi:alanine racemase